MALKICIRPDLSAVVQVGAIDPSEDAIKLFKFYLQTIYMLLQHTSN
jgi:hypothetical protein